MSDLEPLATLSKIGPDGVGLRVEFHQRSDRITHRFLAYTEAGETAVLLESIAEDANLDWPIGPVLQELNLEQVGDSRQQVAMLVGKAGDAHWSVVVRPHEREQQVGFVVENACRVKSKPSWLGSTYLLRDDIKSRAALESIELETQIGSFQTTALPAEEQQPQTGKLSIQHGRLTYLATPEHEVSPPTTIQWRYSISLM